MDTVIEVHDKWNTRVRLSPLYKDLNRIT